MKPALIVCVIAVGMALLLPGTAVAKGGDYRPETFRFSGGDLPHAVTVSLAEYNMAVSGQGTWYTIPSGLAEPSSSATRYHVEVVAAADGSSLGQPVEDYVVGPPARITSGGDGTGWAEPIAPISDLLDRYILLAADGRLPERPSLEQVVRASTQTLGAHVMANSKELAASTEARFLELLGQATPVVFGVRGRLIGSRNLHAVRMDVAFGATHLNFSYVPPGPVAPFGLLFNNPQLGNWGYITILGPPGYTADAYAIPSDMDRLMADAGFVGADEGPIVESHVVPLESAQLSYGDDHMEVWLANGPHVRLPVPPTMICTFDTCGTEDPVPPFSGEPLHVQVWPRGIDPFPEAVRPQELLYYAGDATRTGHGVLVETASSAEGDSVAGASQPPYYAGPAFDDALRNTSAQLAARQGGSLMGALAFGAPAVFVGLAMLGWTSWTAERNRRRRR